MPPDRAACLGVAAAAAALLLLRLAAAPAHGLQQQHQEQQEQQLVTSGQQQLAGREEVAGGNTDDASGSSSMGSSTGSSSSSTDSSTSSRASSGGTAPVAIRLSLGEGPDEMVVMWSTQLPPAGQACVQYQQHLPEAGAESGAAAGHSAELPGAAAAAVPTGGSGSSDSSGSGGSNSNSGSSSVSRRLRQLVYARPAASGSSGSADRIANGGEGAEGAVQTACGSSAPFIEPATGEASQQLHTVILRGLAPGQHYRYRCGSIGTNGSSSSSSSSSSGSASGSGGSGSGSRSSGSASGGRGTSEDSGWSGWLTFRAKRDRSQFSEQQPTSLLLVGDMGLYNAQALPALQADAGSGVHDALLHVGDISYDLQDLQGRRATQFLSRLQPLAGSLPYMVAAGNHEWHHNFSHYRHLFAMPGRQLSQNLHYSFDLGPLHVLVYNTEVFFWPDLFQEAHMAGMLSWMEGDLQAANANRAQVPWVLAVGHRPMYCVQATADGRCNAEHEASRLGIPSFCPYNNPFACRPLHPPGSPHPTFPVEPLFQRYGVDLAVYGHVHDYERYWPAYNHTTLLRQAAGNGGGGSGSSSDASSSSVGAGSTPSGSSISSASSSSAAPVDGRKSSSARPVGPANAASPPAPDDHHSKVRGGGKGSLWRYEDPGATVHVTTGAGGNSEMRRGPEAPPQGPCSSSAPWCAFQSGYAPQGTQSSDYSHSRLTVYNSTHLRWQQYSSTFGRVVDEWWLVQRQHGPFAAAAASGAQ